MTDAQQRAIAAAFLTLETEFDHVLIAVRDREVHGKTIQDDPVICWAGSRIIAKDLAEISIYRLGYSHATRCPPTVTKNIMDEVMKKIQ